MKRSTLSALSAVAILVGVMYAPPVFAQAAENSMWNITEPTNVGGTVLEPGQYKLSVVRTSTSRNFVRVTSPDGTKLFATALTVPHLIAPNEVIPNSTFVYYDAADGQPRALRTWYATVRPGGIGHDFVYEEAPATMIARTSNAPVVVYRGALTEDALDDADLYVVTPDARVETYVWPDTTTTVRSEPVAIAEVRTERTELPATAGHTPLLALLGLLSIAGAFAFRAINQ